MSAADLQGMNRREAVRRIALLMGGAVVGSQFILGGQPVPGKWPAAGFSDADKALLDEIGETIIPATDIPGAKDAKIGAFMAMMVTDCYSDNQHAAFLLGMRKINDAAWAKYGSGFMDCTPAQRTELANLLDAEQRAYNKAKPQGSPAHYFRMMKELTILGYYSSEIGCTKAVRYVEVPGAYHGDYPYKKGDRAWY
jgi:hypothetical protein